MTLVRALRRVLADVAALAPRGDVTWFLLLAALVLQVAFWYLATPGPNVLGAAGRDPATALTTVAWTVLTLFLVPMALMRWVGIRPADAGLGVGNARFGLAAVAALAILAVPVVLVASGDASLQASYPWAGAWPGERWATLATWALTYALYYVSFEFFYRGFVMRIVGAPWGAGAAMWLQVVMSTMIHMGKPLPETLAAAPASLVFGVLAMRSRSVLYPAFVHWIIGLTLDVAILYRLDLLLP